jgi:hypothetical protein
MVGSRKQERISGIDRAETEWRGRRIAGTEWSEEEQEKQNGGEVERAGTG